MSTIEDQLARYGDHLDSLPAPTIAPRRSRPRVALALVAATALAVTGVAMLRREEPPTALGAGGTPVALVLGSLPDGTTAHGRRAPYELDAGRAVYGPAGGVRPDQVVRVEVMPGGGGIGTDGAARTEVQGHPAVLRPLDGGGAMLQWNDGDLLLLVTAASGVDDATLRQLAEGVVAAADLSISATWLPDAWVELWDVQTVVGTFTESVYFVDLGGGDHITVTSWADPPPGALYAIQDVVDATPLDVRGAEGLLDAVDESNPFLWWQDRTGLVVLVQYSGGAPEEAHRIAESLVPVDAAGWSQVAPQQARVDVATTSTTVAP